MGSFSMICSASGLGIDHGTPVRCLLLTQSPYVKDDPRKAWIIRTPPLRAKYNDYGSIEDVHKDDLTIAQLWLRGLREDVVVKGMGDNCYHDLAVAKDMDFKELLYALRAERVEVIQDKNFWHRPIRGEAVKDWVSPLMERIEKALTDTMADSVSRHGGEKKYVVDEPVPGMGRVRWGRYQHGEEHMAALKNAQVTLGLAGFATVITAGTGRYADDADVLVFPRPKDPGAEGHVSGPLWDMRKGADADDEKHLRVGMAMIREDVWQAMIAFPHTRYVSDRQVEPLAYPHVRKGSYAWHDLFAFKPGVKKTWEAIRRKFAGEPVPEGELDVRSDSDKRFEEFIEKHRKAEEERRAKLTDTQRAAEDEENKERLAKWKAEEQRKKDHPFFGDFRISHIDAPNAVHELPGAWIFFDSTPGVIGVSEHFSMLYCDKEPVSENLLSQVAELSAVRHVLGMLGVVLRPAESSGPQFPEWGDNVRMLEALMRIARAELKESEGVVPPSSMAEIAPDVAKAEPKPKKKAKVKRAAPRKAGRRRAGARR